jgi:hypothetical protein
MLQITNTDTLTPSPGSRRCMLIHDLSLLSGSVGVEPSPVDSPRQTAGIKVEG